MEKRPLDIDLLMRRVAEAVRERPKAALFELAERGYTTPFEQLVACILSIRTRDEVMLPTALDLFAVARSPRQLMELGSAGIDPLIRSSSFHEQKAETLFRLAEEVVTEHGGELPCDAETLMSFRGVGPKCANLVLGIACGKASIGVDIHVHRVTNRWGYVAAPTPEATMRQLEERLPEKYWVEINRILVPFGKHICQGKLPRCSTCPVLDLCRQVGVTSHR
jgi:endonuclease III